MIVPVARGWGVCAWAGGLIGAAIAMSPVVCAAEELQFAIAGGRVTLIARDAPLGDVLAAWERAGGTRFVDAGGLDAAPVSLHLVDVPEGEALRLLLRPAAGYLAVARSPRVAGASVYDRVKILAVRSASPPPRSVAPTGAARAAATTTSPAARASGARRPADDLGTGVPPPALTEEAQIERLQRLLHPRGRGDESADSAPETPLGAQVPLTTPRPGMIVDPGRAEAAEAPRRRYRGSPRDYDPFTVFPQGDER